MKHMDLLAARFGAGAVLGGQCIISATLDDEARILHLNDIHFLSFGEQSGAKSPRVAAIAATFSGAKFDSQLSTAILQEMWEKWAFIAAAAGICCLMRGAFGDIAAAGGSQYASAMFAECCAIAAKNGFNPGETAVKRSIGMLTAAGSPIAASMLRDIERGAAIEADHIVGDLLARGGARQNDYPLVQIAYAHLRTYEARRQREKTAATTR
jgi:2-dehydropantoate 2-reductase